MSSVQQAMQTLTAQWYNAIVTGCGLDPNKFQLVQGATPLGTTSEQMWAVFDSVPALSVTTFYDPNQINSLASAYQGVISAVIPQGSLQFTEDLGDYASAWDTYRSTISPVPGNNLQWAQAFAAWAQANLPQSLVQKAQGDYDSMLEDPIAQASNRLLVAQFAPKNAGIYAYTVTAGQLSAVLDKAISKTVTMDSRTESSDVRHTWAKAAAEGFFEDFFLGGESSYDEITTRIATAGVQIEVNFTKLANVTARPLSQPSTDTYLQNFTPWFVPAALGEAYGDRSNTTWKSSSSITWDSTFGVAGSLQRFASALIVVDGITLTMTSKVGLSTSDQKTVQTALGGGFFPFFEAEGAGGWESTVKFDDQGNMVVTASSQSGNPQVLGVLVTPIAQIF